MRRFIIVLGLLMAMVTGTQVAKAEDVALIYGDIGQIETFIESDGGQAADFIRPLRAAGFRVVQSKNRSSGFMRLAAQTVEDMVARGQVDRLAIIVFGPLANSPHDSWAMSNGAGAATPINIGVSGLSLNALSDLASRANGRAVMMIAPGVEVETLGAGLQPGLGKVARAEGVTYVTGPSAALAEVLGTRLLDPTQTLADAARDAPQGVRFTGYMSDQTGLMAAPARVGAPQAVEQGFWLAVTAMDTADSYALYLRRYPQGQYGDDARAAVERLKTEPQRQASAAEEALGLRRDARRTIQRNLSLLGFDPRGIDGVFGPGSRAAITAWQDDNGFEGSGYLTGNQVQRLNSQAQARATELDNEARQRQAEQDRADRAYWRDFGRKDGEAGLRAYLERYPDGQFSETARTRLDAIEEKHRAATQRDERDAWDKARELNTINAYQSFLQSYPNSGFAASAQTRLRAVQDTERNAVAIDRAKAEEAQITAAALARKLIERRLAAVGAEPGEVDGKFTSQTRQAIRRFQTHHQLPVTGYISHDTMVRLMGGR